MGSIIQGNIKIEIKVRKNLHVLSAGYRATSPRNAPTKGIKHRAIRVARIRAEAEIAIRATNLGTSLRTAPIKITKVIGSSNSIH